MGIFYQRKQKVTMEKEKTPQEVYVLCRKPQYLRDLTAGTIRRLHSI